MKKTLIAAILLAVSSASFAADTRSWSNATPTPAPKRELTPSQRAAALKALDMVKKVAREAVATASNLQKR